MTSNNIRVRFAPSPTGYLHVGGLRTALYNYLFAKKNGGTFVLRIEDTDRARFVEGAVENLIDTLKWAGVDFDEGPGKEGSHGPYVQSERLAIYRKHIDLLLAKGSAYRCFCTSERLDQVRKEREKLKLAPKYDRHCLNLTAEEIEKLLQTNTSFVVRMKVPEATTIAFRDAVREEVEFASDALDDQILLKSDGYPTYHLANVVDDHLMEITHVIRGEEWLSSTPKHVLLYKYFEWELPLFAHLPLLLNADRSKLSKRQGDVAVEDYRTKGYLKEALVNFVALLGWNPGTEQEIFSKAELVEQFSLDHVNKAGAIFNIEKLDWLNFEHLRKASDGEVLAMLKDEIRKSPYSANRYSDEYLLNVIRAMRERMTFVRDILDKSPYFFESPAEYDASVAEKRWKPETAGQLKQLAEEFSGLDRPGKEQYEQALQQVAARLNIGNGSLIHAIRLAVSGVGTGPGVYELLEILGKDESVKRIHHAIANIQHE